MASEWNIDKIRELEKQGKIRGFTDVKKSSKKSKYGNKKTVVDGITFDSKKEANRYFDLKLLKLNGLISDLRLQVRYELEVDGKKVAAYVADFVYQEGGREIVEDVKSSMTRKLPVYRLKKKLMLAIYGIEIREV